MDFITPLPTTKNGNTGILNVVCKLSKMIRLICLPKKVDAEIIASFLSSTFIDIMVFLTKLYVIEIPYS